MGCKHSIKFDNDIKSFASQNKCQNNGFVEDYLESTFRIESHTMFFTEQYMYNKEGKKAKAIL